MNFLDKFRYTYDDLNELGIVQNNKNDTKNFNNQNLRNLLSSSVKVSENLFPKISSSINNVFNRLGVKNNFNFFITANHIQTKIDQVKTDLTTTLTNISTSAGTNKGSQI